MFDDDDWLCGGHQSPYIPILFLLLTLCVSGWATCTSANWSPCAYGLENCPYTQSCQCGNDCDENNGYTMCSSTPAFTFSGADMYEWNGNYYTGCINKNKENSCFNNRCGYSSFGTRNGSWVCNTVCTNLCEASEIVCREKGGSWDDANCECKTCQNDTTWNSEKSCSGPNGAGLYVNSFYEHTIKDCQETVIKHTWQSASCDTIKDSTYKCLGTINGHTMMMRAPNGATFNCEADGSCNVAMTMIASGECGPSPSPNPNSSNSNNSSSSEEQSSSSEEQSSSSEDEPNSSETQQQNSSNSVSVAELPQRLYDSLGAIDASIQWYQVFVSGIYDGVWELSGTAHDINTNTRNTSNYVLEMKDTLHNSNQLLKQIANKDFSPDIHVGSPDVNIDVSGIQSNQNQTRDSLHNTNSLLEDIKGLLGSSGSDTIHVDTSKAPASIDSALKHWGNNSNHTFGAAGLDSSGWGAAQKGMEDFSDSVTNDVGMINPFADGNCDTTGGRKCDGQYIGSHGLDSATKHYKNAYRELGDSITNGAYGDSLRNWGSKFTSSRLSGSGSDNCPAILNRTWNVPIGNVNMTFGPIGKYICTPIFGGLNAFGLARTLLRAIVAIACMWFLFKCATGFKGSGSEDDD